MSERRHVGIRDVARTAGVSITTVSHALNGKGGVSEETRRRVREIADRLGYRPDPRGRQLASGRTGLVALTVSMPDGVHARVEQFAHNAALIDAAIAAAVARGLAAVIVPAGEASIWDRLPLDGLIVVDPVPDDPTIRELDRSFPVVTVGKVPGGGVDTRVVDNDYAHGTRAILDHMEASGAGRVGLLSLRGGESYELDSLDAYRAWCDDRGLDPWIYTPEELDWTTPDTWDRLTSISRSAAATCLDRPDIPDAVYCLSEPFALALVTEATERRLDVPGDLMVASLADLGLAARSVPPITTLELFPRELGAAAAEVLADLVEGGAPAADPVVVPTAVVPRASTARQGEPSTARQGEPSTARRARVRT
jgi:DNA-binding LacI/PurR family transcriptional regulator